jgi:hypothetical protein
MSLKEENEIKKILKFVDSKRLILEHNKSLFKIMEGDLLTFILEDLAKQMSSKSFNIIKHRVAPINLLRKLVDKLSMIYSTSPTRTVESKNKNDMTLMNFYVKSGNWDQKLNLANENFNTYKNTWVEPFVSNGKPQLRSIPSDRFLVYSDDPMNELEPTHFIKFLGKRMKGDKALDIMQITTKDEVTIVDEKGERQLDMLQKLKNIDGVNPFKTLPGIYLNRSHNMLVPIPDSDTIRMTKLLPVLISDLNYAVMFQAFSIIWGIDVNDENLQMAPNAFWRFKSDKKGIGDSKPQIGVIKPEVDIAQVVDLIKNELGMWLQSKNIKPGSIGKLDSQNISSGISKMVDEMDTFEDREKQVRFFKPGEELLWRKIAENFHPIWVERGLIDEKKRFSASFEPVVEFVDQRPMFNRTEVLEEVEKEMSLGILDKKRAAQRVNPTQTEEQIDELLADVEAERTIEMGAEGGGHIHKMPDGSTTGPAIDVGEGLHSHSYSGGETEPAKEGQGHTHRTDGGSTGPPIEQGESEDEA